ncbi:hypothetical protein RHGRI_020894 [Rhododendron griersonianum]|uniref:Uncharacterized protein n=1 Tax=Rhododendron griersonianum TaxID=479676 RepID=A0AAV6JNA4_9ERIC|nr:hypothetical protein RHGRI_020894 [Rhododendron griersonianum]
MILLIQCKSEEKENTEVAPSQKVKMVMFTKSIPRHMIHDKDLRKHGVTLYFFIDKDRNPVHDVQPTQPNVHRIAADASRSLYAMFQLNFSSSISVLHVIVSML